LLLAATTPASTPKRWRTGAPSRGGYQASSFDFELTQVRPRQLDQLVGLAREDGSGGEEREPFDLFEG
jgi:hypothetical protein